MNGFDRNQLMAVLLSAMTALFVLSRMPPAAQWRRRFRWAAIALYVIAAALALAAVAAWLAGWNG